MSKLEEVSSKRLVLIDSSTARKNHIFMLAISLLIGLVYTAFLWIVCSTIRTVMSTLLLFISQIAMGFPATRAYYDLGVSNRENLQFIDPAKISDNGKHHTVEIHLGEIPLIFEKIDINISKFDKGSLDDLNDLSWFGILVWAAISSTSFFFGIGGHPLCLLGTLVFLIASLMSYLSGYRIRRDYGFEDDLSHLQYFVEKRLWDIDTSLSEIRIKNFVHVIERRTNLVLEDFSVKITFPDESSLNYHMGFPSNELERIVVKTKNAKVQGIYDRLTYEPIIQENGWKVKQTETPSVYIVEILNERSSFSVNNRTSFVTSPSLIDEAAKMTAKVFSDIHSLLIFSNSS
ncbi:MAG: hypothetical protein AM325_004830 [Candidatus Thorarchaeota archaeon SMTZ1-45]|nr:MAG: hypothetical protein AM325_06595 [Candidatus Thorarchaeota archaeon SMTZ1-45]